MSWHPESHICARRAFDLKREPDKDPPDYRLPLPAMRLRPVLPGHFRAFLKAGMKDVLSVTLSPAEINRQNRGFNREARRRKPVQVGVPGQVNVVPE